MNLKNDGIRALAAAGALALSAGLALGPHPSLAASGGLPVDIRSIATIAPVRTDNCGRAQALYRGLLPAGLSMPPDPMVAIWLTEPSGPPGAVYPQDGVSHWMEGSIQVRVLHGKEEGWMPISYPVSSEFWFQLGRNVGLPKYHATMTMTHTGTSWTADTIAQNTGKPSVRLTWTPGPAFDPATTALTRNAPISPLFTLSPPLAGTDLKKVQYQLTPPNPPWDTVPDSATPYSDTAAPQVGVVHLVIDPNVDALAEADTNPGQLQPRPHTLFPAGASLADIINPDQVRPGTLTFFNATLNSVTTDQGTVGGYTGPAPAALPGCPVPAPKGEQGPAQTATRTSLPLTATGAPGHPLSVLLLLWGSSVALLLQRAIWRRHKFD